MSVQGFNFDGTVHQYEYGSLLNIPQNLAQPYSTSATYAVGDYCTYNNVLYKCTTAISTAESWTSGHWSAVKLTDDVGDLKSALNDVDEILIGRVNNINKNSGLTLLPVALGDSVTIKRTDGLPFANTDQLRFYDSAKNYIEYWTVSPGCGAIRTFTYSGVLRDATYIGITSVDTSTDIVNYTVVNNTRPSLQNESKRFDVNLGDYLSNLFELGNISISETGWIYSDSGSRLRTKENTFMHLKEGTVVGLLDYAGYTYYVGWRKSDGTYDYYNGWRQQDFTAPIEADYVFLIRNSTESNITDPKTFANNFFGYSLSDDISQNVYGSFDEFEKIPFTAYIGYITSTGEITPAGDSKEVYTSLIPCISGDVFSISITYTASHILWVCCGLYDEFGDFITRISLETYRAGYGGSYEATINNDKARYIAFTYRTFDDATAVIKSKKILSIPTNASLLLKEQLEWHVSKINENVKSINHRGYNSVAPENTIPAYKLSRRNGFDYVETDISFTSDGVAVLLHDDTINRTARNADGTAIESTISISDITYAEALEYDFGIWKGETYTGTKIPTFEQFISLCKKIGLNPYIELKASGTTQERIASLVATVSNYKMLDNVTWISFIPDYLQYVKNNDPTARLGVVCNELTSTIVSDAIELKTSDNDVFIDTQNGTSEEVTLAKNADLPIEVWNVNTATGLNALNGYISGATTDALVFGYELYKANV